MKRMSIAFLGLAGLVACAPGPRVDAPPMDAVAGSGQIRPVARPAGGAAARPPAGARTAEQFDTTSTQEKAAAVQEAKAAQQSGAGQRLGRTVVSLGDPAQPGLWIKTPLVAAHGQGRVVYPANGKAVQLELIPIDGPKTAGSRMSLAALRAVGAPLTDLTEVDVYTE